MCSILPSRRMTLDDDLSAPARARGFVRDHPCPEHGASAVEVSELLVSELVSNAVCHGAPPVVLHLDCEGAAGLLVRVSDTSAALPRQRRCGQLGLGGRGLQLVDALSEEWGVEPGSAGKTVWFRLLPTPRTGLGCWPGG